MGEADEQSCFFLGGNPDSAAGPERLSYIFQYKFGVEPRYMKCRTFKVLHLGVSRIGSAGILIGYYINELR